MNNFNMSVRLSPQKQRQKADLVFNYMKQLKPFEQKDSNSIHEAELALKKFQEDLRQKREPVMALSSRVYQLKLGSKKKVTFLDELSDSNRLKNQDVLYGSLMSLSDNPEQIKNQLLQLQKSVYSSFKIESSSSTFYRQDSSLFRSIPLAQSLLLQSNSKFNSSKDQKQRRIEITTAKSTPFRAMRSKSQLLLNSRIEQISEKRPTGYTHKPSASQNKISLGRSKQNQYTSQANRNYMSSLSRSQSASRVQQKKNTTRISNYSSAPRSEQFWKQQNSLMIEIFKTKLGSNKRS